MYITFTFTCITDPWLCDEQINGADKTEGLRRVRHKSRGRPQVQSKRINLISLTMDLFSVLLTKFQLI